MNKISKYKIARITLVFLSSWVSMNASEAMQLKHPHDAHSSAARVSCKMPAMGAAGVLPPMAIDLELGVAESFGRPSRARSTSSGLSVVSDVSSVSVSHSGSGLSSSSETGSPGSTVSPAKYSSLKLAVIVGLLFTGEKRVSGERPSRTHFDKPQPSFNYISADLQQIPWAGPGAELLSRAEKAGNKKDRDRVATEIEGMLIKMEGEAYQLLENVKSAIALARRHYTTQKALKSFPVVSAQGKGLIVRTAVLSETNGALEALQKVAQLVQVSKEKIEDYSRLKTSAESLLKGYPFGYEQLGLLQELEARESEASHLHESVLLDAVSLKP